jgi:mono/diheme cytochrome c family protein
LTEPAIWVVLISLVCAPAAPSSAAEDGRELFQRQIRPILVDKCLACHASDVKKGGLDLTRRAQALLGGSNGAALVAEKPDESLLVERLSAGEMPPKQPLTPGQIAAFRAWIAAGAPYDDEPLSPRRAGPDWWSLRSVQRASVPPTGSSAWVRSPIDAFIKVKLDEQGLAPAPEVDRVAYIRRVTFDLIGLPPSPQEIDAFVRDDRADAHERLVDGLLGRPQYGERWGRHWLDVVRFGESHGYETNALRPNAWPYRDYVIRSFNRDTPFAQFVQEQLAGDTRNDGDWLTQSATGFIVGGTHDVVGNQTVEGMLQQRADDLDDMITATATAFLGLTVNCARCHDHKFDPIAQRDYYGLQAIFAGVNHAERETLAPGADDRRRERRAIEAELASLDRQLDLSEPLTGPGVKETRRPPVNPRRNVERFLPTAARLIRFSVSATNNGIEPCLDELEIYSAGERPWNLALASDAKVSASSEYPNSTIHKIPHINDGRYGNGRSWISQEPGKGWIQIELPNVAMIDRIVWGRDREGKYSDRLAISYRIEAAVEPGAWQLIASSDDRAPMGSIRKTDRSISDTTRRDDLLSRLAASTDTIKIYSGTFSPPGPTHRLLRGDPTRKAEVVAPSGVATIRPALSIPSETPEAERRKALAEWIAHPDNPLPARVMVNRLWHYHFGRGLVSTPSDFGFNGDRPSHPELLDWLASELLSNGGHLKPIHRLIVLSSTYRQSSRIDPKARAVDDQNRLLWRMTPRRLEAEAIRDAILTVSGQLDLRVGGPGYSIWEPNTNYVVVFKPRVDLGPDSFRRMVYQFKPRSQADPTFGAFDCPDAALVVPRRNASTTALQALNLLNSRFILSQSEAFAARLRREAGADPALQVQLAFRLAVGRDPTALESSAAIGVAREHGLAVLCRALFNSSEFVFVN